MNLKQQFITSKSRPRQPLYPIGIVLHDTDTAGANSQNEHDYFQNQAPDSSAHAFVDKDGIIQIIPFNEKAWHVGRYGNSKFIGIELCVPKNHNVDEFNKIWQNGVELFAYLYKNVLKKPCNNDTFWWHERVSRELGGTDHVDPVPFFKGYGKTVQDFKNDVIKAMSGNIVINNKNISNVKLSNPFPRVPLKTGMSGNDIKVLQNAMNKILKPEPQYKVIENGIYSDGFANVIKNFQEKYNLIQDGVAGQNTINKVKALLNIKA